MKKFTSLGLALIFSSALLVGGCGGGGAKVEATTTTMGQELQDLDEAYKKGLLSDSEYKKARKKIMKKYN
ncbi:MAG: hypothetical protein ACWA5Q_01070 [bacterium]